MPAIPFLTAVLVLSACTAAQAAVITEPTDLSNILTAPTALAPFTIGVNTVSGTVDAATGDTHDIFRITLPAGASLSSYSVTITDFGGSSPLPNFALFATPGPSSAGLVGVNSSGNFTLQFSNSRPAVLTCTCFGMGAGSVNPDGSLFLSQTASHYSYTATFQVVPTPAAASLFALAALPLTRRRR